MFYSSVPFIRCWSCTVASSTLVWRRLSRLLGLDTHCFVFLNKVTSKGNRSINCTPLNGCLQYLTFQCNIACLAISSSYFHGYCSSELHDSPLPVSWLHKAFNSSSSFFFHLTNARVIKYFHSCDLFSLISSGRVCVSLLILPMSWNF